FDDRNYLNQDYTSDVNELLLAINNLTPQGGTDYDKGLLLNYAGSLIISKKAKYKPVIVFLTDGYPNKDPQVATIIKEAKLQGCPIFAVMVGLYCPQSLKQICSQTGGLWFENINSVGEALEVYNIILKRSQGIEPCTITWESTASCDVEERKVKVKWNNGPSSEGAYFTSGDTKVRLNISPKSIYMKFKTLGIAYDSIVTVSSQQAAVTVYDITSSNNQYSITPNKFSLIPGASIQLKVHYTPTSNNYTWTKFEFTTDVCPLILYASAGQKGKTDSENAVKLLEPNGSEVFLVGSDTVITWTGIPASDVVKLEYSTNNGTSWLVLSEGATGGSYDWKNIPNTPSNSCLVKVTQIPNNLSESNSFQLFGHTDALVSVRWSPDGKYVATASEDSTAIVWDATTGVEITRFKGHKGRINSLEWNRESITITTSSSDSTARIWEAATGNELHVFKGHRESVECASLSPDHIKMATASKDNTVILWNSSTGEIMQRLIGHTQSISQVSWNPDGMFVGTSKSDTRIFDAVTGSDIALVGGHTNYIDYISWSPNGKQIATASRDNTARIWDASNGKSIFTLEGHTGAVKHLCWSPDGSKIVTASADNSAQIWDALTGIPLQKLIGHSGEVVFVSWSPDSRGIATASADNTARIWDAATGKELKLLKGHADKVNDIVWSPDASHVATSSPDNSAWIWDVSGAFAVLSDVSDAVFSIVAPLAESHNIIMPQVNVGMAKDSLVVDFIKNKSTYPFEVREIRFSNGDTSDFKIISGFPPFNVAALASKPVEFRFSPSSEGKKAATIIIITQNDTLTQTISGEGVTRQIEVINGTINFGSVEVNTEKDTLKALTIKNIGKIPVTITGTRHGTPNDKDFSTISGGGSFILMPDSIKQMDLKFVPSIEGRTSGTLLFDYNGVGSPATVGLFGEGVAPKLEIVNKTIDFGKVVLGSSKDSLQAVTIKNAGTMVLTIYNVWYYNQNTNEFTTLAGGGNFIVKPRDSARMDLRFTPKAIGVRSEKLLFDYNGTGPIPEIILTGEGIPKNYMSVKVLNNVIDFGKVIIDSPKDTIQAVTIQNNGNVAISITDIQLQNSSETSFTILSNPAPLIINPNDIIRLDIRFIPNSLGIKNNKIQFSYQGSATPAEVTITGEGINNTPSIQLLNSSIDFGKVEVGSFKDTLRAVTIKNIGKTAITVTDVQNALLSEQDFTILNNPAPKVLNPNDTFFLDLKFTPSVDSKKIGRFRFNFDNSVLPIEMGLKGEGFKITKPTASAMFTIGSAEANAGETVLIPIKLNAPTNILESGIEKFHVRISFNTTLLEPIGTTPFGVMQGNKRIIELDLPNLPIDGGNNTLLQLQFRAGLGNDSISAITLDSIEAIGGTGQFTHENGKFKLLGICPAGGPRLLNPNGIITLSVIHPNPAHEYAEIQLETTESGLTTLELYTMQGQKVRTYINGQIEPSSQIISLDLTNISSGKYILILQTPTERRTTSIEVLR
ncbi:MAG: choice-of-anchor D domain-containing protein, partial [Ignavibacteriae bacterium]|nr:choice-of-anchor D domain-containing protein [Ignavibacteriota bacterium]